MTLGERISALRRKKKYSQEYVAEHMNVSRQAVSKWEKNLSIPDTKNLIRLADLFGVSVEYLMTGQECDCRILPGSDGKLVRILRRMSLAFFLVALCAHCSGIITGLFTRNLIPVFPFLWYGTSVWAIVLNIATALFTAGWICLLIMACALVSEDKASAK